MEQEIKKLLEKNLAVSRESLHILKKMRRDVVVSRVFKVIYWLMIVGIIIGLYIYLKPYIDKLQGVFQNIQIIFQDIQNLKENIPLIR